FLCWGRVGAGVRQRLPDAHARRLPGAGEVAPRQGYATTQWCCSPARKETRHSARQSLLHVIVCRFFVRQENAGTMEACARLGKFFLPGWLPSAMRHNLAAVAGEECVQQL